MASLRADRVRVASVLGLLFLHVTLIGSVVRDKRAVHALARHVVTTGTSEGETVRRLADYVRDRLYHPDRADVERMPALIRWTYLYGPFSVGPGTALEYGGNHKGACGSSSQVLMEMLAAHGLESRFVILANDALESLHTLLEVRYNGSWGAVDPLYGIVYQHPDGRPASVKDLRRDEALFAGNAREGWEFGYGRAGIQKRKSYDAAKFPFRNAHYFHYAKLGSIGRWTHDALGAALGEDATLWIRRPGFYAFPALTTLVVVDALLFSAWVGILCLARVRRIRAGAGERRAGRSELLPQHTVDRSPGV